LRGPLQHSPLLIYWCSKSLDGHFTKAASSNASDSTFSAQPHLWPQEEIKTLTKLDFSRAPALVLLFSLRDLINGNPFSVCSPLSWPKFPQPLGGEVCGSVHNDSAKKPQRTPFSAHLPLRPDHHCTTPLCTLSFEILHYHCNPGSGLW
jgi:hypothetical protein